MIEFAEILPYLFMLVAFVSMVLVSVYRRDMFAEDRTTISISQTAQNIPVDRIESPYRLNIQESRSTLKGRKFNHRRQSEFILFRWCSYSTTYGHSMPIKSVLVCKYPNILFRIRLTRFSISII